MKILNSDNHYKIAGLTLLTIAIGHVSLAQDTLPYTQRTKAYPGWTSTVKGDRRMVGMGGALVGLGDTKLSAIDNPAGLAMAMDDDGIEFSRNLVRDRALQPSRSSVEFTDFTAALTTYPWGFGYASWTPLIESQTYLLADGTEVQPKVESIEYRFSAARVLMKNRLSLGVSLLHARTVESLTLPATFQSYNLTYTTWSMSLGATVQLPRRWLVGMSYHFPFTATTDQSLSTAGISSFLQPAQTPWRLGIGTGWIPNRNFQLGVSLYFIGPSPGVALLKDENATLTSHITLQPRLGASYRWLDFENLRSDLTLGTYYEVSRVASSPDRSHFTMGLHAKPWLLDLGWTTDFASDFKNHIFTVGVDIGKVLKILEFIPPGQPIERQGLLPQPLRINDDGLPRPLVADWKDPGTEHFIETGQKLPNRVENKLKKTGKDVQKFFEKLGSFPSEVGKGTKNKTPY